MIRLFISDDHPILREGLKHVVAQYRDIEVVGEAEDADATYAGCVAKNADVLLLDVSMPGPGILEVIARLKELNPRLRILVLSVHPERHYAKRVLKAGADGYLTKNQSPQALASAIRQVFTGKKYITTSLAQEFAVDLSSGREAPAHEALSNREYQVFLKLGSGESAQRVAQVLNLSPKTVRTYRSRILEKMGLNTTAELIFYAVQRGLVTDVATGSLGGGVVAGSAHPVNGPAARTADHSRRGRRR
jgi:DNA-binding NarL/FixJ family response regulator